MMLKKYKEVYKVDYVGKDDEDLNMFVVYTDDGADYVRLYHEILDDIFCNQRLVVNLIMAADELNKELIEDLEVKRVIYER